jgi:hypothetical protein
LLLQLFREMDADDSGFLDQQEIAILADKLGLALTETELQAAMIAVRTACRLMQPQAPHVELQNFTSTARNCRWILAHRSVKLT